MPTLAGSIESAASSLSKTKSLRISRRPSALTAQPPGEDPHFLRVEVGRHPVVHPAVTPMEQVVPVMRGTLDRALGAIRGRPNKDVDYVLVALVNQRRHGPAVEVVETAADQTVAVRGEVVNWRREIDPSVEPRLDRVLVGRDYVHQMTGHQRAQMAGQDLRRNNLSAIAQRRAAMKDRAVAVGPPFAGTDVERDDREHRECGSRDCPSHRAEHPDNPSAEYSAHRCAGRPDGAGAVAAAAPSIAAPTRRRSASGAAKRSAGSPSAAFSAASAARSR